MKRLCGDNESQEFIKKRKIYNMQNKRAFVTLLYGNQPFFVEALVLAKSLQSLKEKADIVLLAGEGISDEVKECVKKTKLFTHIIDVPTLEIHDTHIGTVNRWTKLIFNKCHIWNLTQYEKVIFLDADIIVEKERRVWRLFEDFSSTTIPAATLMGNDLITHKKLVNVEQSRPEHSKLSGGLLVITPNNNTFNEMCAALKEPSKYAGQFFTNHEEIFLSVFFSQWYSIHVLYQFAPLWLMTYKEAKHLLYPFTEDDIIAVHFVGYKPHLYLKQEDYVKYDKEKYKRFKNGYHIFVKFVDKWLKLSKKVNKRLQKKCKKTCLQLGDWETPIIYKW